MDMEGIVCQRKDSPYKVTETPSRYWIKVKNSRYSQLEGREELFERESHIKTDRMLDRAGVITIHISRSGRSKGKSKDFSVYARGIARTGEESRGVLNRSQTQEQSGFQNVSSHIPKPASLEYNTSASESGPRDWNSRRSRA